MRRLTCLLLLLVAATSAHGEESLVGGDAPALEIESWASAAEGPSLEALEGRVVVLLLGGALDPTDADSIARWNDLRAAYFEAGLRVVGLLPTEPDEPPMAIEFSVAIGAAAAYGTGETPRVILIAADGKVVWDGAPGELSDERIAKLVRKSEAFPLRSIDPALKPLATAFKKGQLASARDMASVIDHEDAEHVMSRVDGLLAYWQNQVERSTAAGNPAETACYLSWIAKYLDGASEGTEAAAALKALKRDRAAVKEIKAAVAYARLRGDWVKTKGKRRKIDAVVRKGESFIKRNQGTRGAERAARLVARIKADPAVSAIRAFIKKQRIKTKGANWRTALPRPPEVTFEDKRDYFWHLETSEGPITLRFFPDSAPVHVANIIYLTELAFFDGLTFHRVMPGFMAQGGCPDGSGSGSAGYKFDGEFDPDRKHDRPGILSAAHAGPGTDGCQFFITFAPASHLDGKHTVYGETVSGKKTLEKLEALATSGGTPKKRIVIDRATITVE